MTSLRVEPKGHIPAPGTRGAAVLLAVTLKYPSWNMQCKYALLHEEAGPEGIVYRIFF